MRIERRGFFRLLAGAMLAAPTLPALLAHARSLLTLGRVGMTTTLPLTHALAGSLRSTMLVRSRFDALVGPRGDRVIITQVGPLTHESGPTWRERA